MVASCAGPAYGLGGGVVGRHGVGDLAVEPRATPDALTGWPQVKQMPGRPGCTIVALPHAAHTTLTGPEAADDATATRRGNHTCICRLRWRRAIAAATAAAAGRTVTAAPLRAIARATLRTAVATATTGRAVPAARDDRLRRRRAALSLLAAAAAATTAARAQHGDDDQADDEHAGEDASEEQPVDRLLAGLEGEDALGVTAAQALCLVVVDDDVRDPRCRPCLRRPCRRPGR